MIIIFSDFLDDPDRKDDFFNALQHLKHNKHEVVLFHTYDEKLEFNFDFENSPKKFVDVETGEQINMYASNVKKQYKAAISKYFNDQIKMTWTCKSC